MTRAKIIFSSTFELLQPSKQRSSHYDDIVLNILHILNKTIKNSSKHYKKISIMS